MYYQYTVPIAKLLQMFTYNPRSKIVVLQPFKDKTCQNLFDLQHEQVYLRMYV